MKHFQSLSGHNYIKVSLKEYGREDIEWSQVKVNSVGKCLHSVTACVDCFDQWAVDYFISKSTAAARRLWAGVAAGKMKEFGS